MEAKSPLMNSFQSFSGDFLQKLESNEMFLLSAENLKWDQMETSLCLYLCPGLGWMSIYHQTHIRNFRNVIFLVFNIWLLISKLLLSAQFGFKC